MAPSFFKILLDPSTPHLALPTDFVSMHLKNNIPNATIIRSANGGYSWRLKIKQIGDSYCFANAWDNVVKDTQLGFGDLLYFHLVDKSTFKMSIYSPDGCEKILPPNIGHDVAGQFENLDDDDGNIDLENAEVNDDKKNEEISDDDPLFKSIITRTHSSFLRFPGGFAELAGIDGEGTMTIKNLEGKESVIRLMLDKSYRSTKRYLLTRGWPRFRRLNDLSLGDECVFRFIRSEGKLSLDKVTKQKWPVRQRRTCCQVLLTKGVERARRPRAHEHGGHVGMDPAEECVEVTKRKLEMPSNGKTSVIYF